MSPTTWTSGSSSRSGSASCARRTSGAPRKGVDSASLLPLECSQETLVFGCHMGHTGCRCGFHIAAGAAQSRSGRMAGELSDVRFLTVAEVADMMRVSKMTIYRMVHAGELPAIRFGRSFRVPESAVQAAIGTGVVAQDDVDDRGRSVG